MSDYTHKNLKELEDMAQGRMPGMEARFGRSAIESEHLGVSFFRCEPNYRQPFGHSHREQEEAYVVVEGSGRMRLGDETIELRPWDVVRVAPNVVRAFEGGPDGLSFLAVGNDRPEGGDSDMVQGFWSD
jgi:mannose-6-phosphate isomerase-like protein (cupin superfamily)